MAVIRVEYQVYRLVEVEDGAFADLCQRIIDTHGEVSKTLEASDIASFFNDETGEELFL